MEVPIYRFVLSHVGNREEAEDLTSQVFLKAVRGMNPEHGPQAMRKWLYQVARTTVADYWRGYYRMRTASLDELSDMGWDGPAAGAAAMGSAGSSHPGERVKRLMQALPDHYREVLNCRFLLNLSIRETASRLGLTEANVKVVQMRAQKRRHGRTCWEQKHVIAQAKHFGEEATMSGEDQERFEDILAVERYIEDLQAGRVAHVPAELTPELARIYRMALLLQADSSEAAAPRPEFIIALEAKLKQEEARHRAYLQGHRSRASSKERQAPPLSLGALCSGPEPALLLRSQ